MSRTLELDGMEGDDVLFCVLAGVDSVASDSLRYRLGLDDLSEDGRPFEDAFG